MLVLLPVEATTHYLEVLTNLIVESFHLKNGEDAPAFLKVITDPLTKLIIQVAGLPLKGAGATSLPLVFYPLSRGRTGLCEHRYLAASEKGQEQWGGAGEGDTTESLAFFVSLTSTCMSCWDREEEVVRASQDSGTAHRTPGASWFPPLTSAPVGSPLKHCPTSHQKGRLLAFPSISRLWAPGSVLIVKMKEGFVYAALGSKGQLRPCPFTLTCQCPLVTKRTSPHFLESSLPTVHTAILLTCEALAGVQVLGCPPRVQRGGGSQLTSAGPQSVRSSEPLFTGARPCPRPPHVPPPSDLSMC